MTYQNLVRGKDSFVFEIPLIPFHLPGSSVVYFLSIIAEVVLRVKRNIFFSTWKM